MLPMCTGLFLRFFGLYAVPLVVPAVGDEDDGGHQVAHLGGVGEVARDGDLGGIVLLLGGLWDDVVGCSFIAAQFSLRVQFELGVEWFRRWRLFLAFWVWRNFGLHQVSWSPGLQDPRLGPPPWSPPLSRLGRGRWCRVLGGGGWHGLGVRVL